MPGKFLNILLVFCVLLTNPALADGRGNYSPFYHALLGSCFSNVNELLMHLGPSYSNDPNVKTSVDHHLGEKWLYIVDMTASKNYTWFLAKEERQVCLRAYIPSASDVTYNKNVGLLEAFISPDPGFPAKKIILKNSKRNYFWPRSCFTRSESSAKRKIWRPIACAKVYD